MVPEGLAASPPSTGFQPLPRPPCGHTRCASWAQLSHHACCRHRGHCCPRPLTTCPGPAVDFESPPDTPCRCPAAGTCQRVWARRGFSCGRTILTASLTGGLPAQLRPGHPRAPQGVARSLSLCPSAPATGAGGAPFTSPWSPGPGLTRVFPVPGQRIVFLQPAGTTAVHHPQIPGSCW